MSSVLASPIITYLICKSIQQAVVTSMKSSDILDHWLSDSCAVTHSLPVSSSFSSSLSSSSSSSPPSS